MRIIISPAKKMNTDTDSLPWRELPCFLDQAEVLLARLRGMDGQELQALWKCSDKLARLNIQRLADIDLTRNLTPAILAYEGIQYRYMAPGVFTGEQLEYIQRHVRILSGFYGLLKPFDGVSPYRLEMQAKLDICQAKNLYEYWNRTISEKLLEETDCILNLASKEYSLCVSKYLPPAVTFVTCVFGEEKKGKIVEKGTMCKMARGEMVRYMAERRVTELEQVKAFSRLDYRFSPEHSDPSTFVFLRP